MILPNLMQLWCLAWLVLCLGQITHAENIKQIRATGYVTDLAGIIKPETKAQLEALCTELEQKTGAQMAIVTVKSLEGESIEEYANELYKQLGIGSKKENRGVLLLVAPNDRKYRPEIGYGLEPVITDARAGDAGRLMVPYFRRGDYSSGIAAAAWQLAKYVADDKGVTLSGMPELRQVRHQEDYGGIWVWLVLGIILFVIFAGRNSGSSQSIRRGRGMGSGWWIGPMSGGGGWGGGGGGFGGFGGGMSGGGGASGSW